MANTKNRRKCGQLRIKELSRRMAEVSAMLCGNTFMLIADAAEEAYRHFAAAEQSTGLKQQHDVGMPLPDVASLKGENRARIKKAVLLTVFKLPKNLFVYMIYS